MNSKLPKYQILFCKKSLPQDFIRKTLIANRVVAIWPWHTVLMLQCTVQTCADLPHTQIFWFAYLLEPIYSRFQDSQVNWIKISPPLTFKYLKKLLFSSFFVKFILNLCFMCVSDYKNQDIWEWWYEWT